VYDRIMDAGGKHILQQRSAINSDYATQPWAARSPDSLHRAGYVIPQRDNSTVYYAPGLDALLANGFVEDHCFRITTSRDASLIGIAFEPTSDRKRVAEIRGTLWLDRASSELRSIEFRYANVSREQQDGDAGGEMHFVRMTNGAWAISAWNIRMPLLTQRVVGVGARATFETDVTSIKVSGGELTVARRGDDTLWSRPPLILAGVVLDSASGASVAGARVALRGTQSQGVTVADGGFEIQNVLPGDYMLEVHTPSLDSVSVVYQVPLLFTDASTPIRLRVPTARQMVTAFCGNTRTGKNPGIVIGGVRMLGDSVAPAHSVTVYAEWKEVALRPADPNLASNESRWLETHSDSHGAFRLCGVPINTPLVLRIESDSGGSAPVTVRIPVDGRVARAELIMNRAVRAAVFAGSVLVDSTERAIAGAEVSLPRLTKTVMTDERGVFRLEDVPEGEQRVVVRRVGYGPLDTTITFVANQMVNRRVFLSRIAMLDSVVVTERLSNLILRDFEENRRVGLGHFFTRADLEKMSGRPLAQVLAQIPGSRVARGKGSYAWMASSRGFRSMTGRDIPQLDGSDAAKGARPACYAQVYLDNAMVYRRADGEPLFNINSLSPDQIEAIEYYASPGQTPAKYTKLGSTCGVLVIWTRRSPN
ncbi:MAG TPA: carboxypeptidase regulatory-like domain-containing protein, partial [Gemmatimonadaceae bacterium]|nr:carboxypeptidase regulatory-like domain-containing protein [Gemmatimonadaceae bacterium]